MARQKSWLPRISLIIQHLEADTRTHYKRSEVEQLFSVGASQAKELMIVAGITGGRPGLDLTVPRVNLLAYVKHSPEAQDALQEIERRKKLAKRLNAAEADLKLRNGVKLRVTKEDEWTRFADLPNVSIQPGLMQVAFTPGDPIDVMDTLWRFVKAAGNEWDEFAKMCTPQISEKIGQLNSPSADPPVASGDLASAETPVAAAEGR